MNIQFLKDTSDGVNRALIFLGSTKSDHSGLMSALAQRDQSTIRRILDKVNGSLFAGDLDQSIFYRAVEADEFDHVLLVGNAHAVLPPSESSRRAGAKTFEMLTSEKVEEGMVHFQTVDEIGPFIEGLILASYKLSEFKTNPSLEDHRFKKITILNSDSRTSQLIVERAQIISEAVNVSRRLGDLPPSVLNPREFGSVIRKSIEGLPIEMEEWDSKRLESEKMNGLLNVGRGSYEEPRMVILRYSGGKPEEGPLCLIGKGVTFDSGGLDLKSAKNMKDMRYDMCGAATVFAVTVAAAKLKIPINLISYAAFVENMPGPLAFKPGDIFVARNGKSIEVMNTDAEGRLILADALCLAQEEGPRAIVDVATLTGSIFTALGNIHTGLFSRSESLASALKRAASDASEPLWELPLCEGHEKDVAGLFADLTNQSASSGAGSSTAAAFLAQFVSADTPWVHLDIAGTAQHIGDRIPYAPKKGASGCMVRTLINFVENFK